MDNLNKEKEEMSKVLVLWRLQHVPMPTDSNIKIVLDILHQTHILNKASEDGELLLFAGLINYIYNKEFPEAIEYFKAAIEKDNLSAISMLANIYLGIGEFVIYKNLPEALRLFNKAIERNDHYAMAQLGEVYYCGIYGVEKNIDEGIRLFELAAKYENTFALKSLGKYYKKNEDYESAVKYFFKYCEITNEPLRHYIDLEKCNIRWTEDLHKHWPSKSELKKYNNSWNEDLHKHWLKKDEIEEQILMLLLISKDRRNHKQKWLVRGIVRKIIEEFANSDGINL